jgi:pimeloyl-ACP methyl ester carboxylesterase
MSYNYTANVSVVESAENNGSSEGRAAISHRFTSTETVRAVENNSCDRGKTWREMSGTSTSQTQTTGYETTTANVSVGVNSDGTYAVSVRLPRISGQTTGTQKSSFSGQCTPKEGKSFSLPPTQTTIDGNSLTSDGSHRINPDDPNRISGSFTQTFLGITETITWNLQKCGAPLRITDLKFEEMKFPNWNEWAQIVEQKGTTDGNLVKIRVSVLNASGETKYADVRLKETFRGDKWDGARPDGVLEGGELSVKLDPGEEREVEMVWDSSGYSWFDDGRPRLVQRIKAELEEGGKKTDELTKNLKVAPKPLVLVHGLWSNWRAWESWQNILTTSHSYDWKAFPVGEKAEKGLMNTGGGFLSGQPTNSIFENAQQLGKYIRYAQEDRNAWHVDIVAHSMGGLISRHYIHNFMPPVEDGRPQVSHLVMLGTPNMGSPCADVMNIAFETLGKDVEAIRQLRQDTMAEFNRVITNRKGVKFSVLAGDPLPVMCKTLVANDGVVPVPSAIWQIKDNAKSKNLHTELTGTSDFSSFVKPRLAIGPKGNHNPAPPELTQSHGQNWGNGEVRGSTFGSGVRYYGAKYIPEPTFLSEKPFARWLEIEPGERTEFELPVAAAEDLGLTFMANASIEITLIDDRGIETARQKAGSPEAAGIFRAIYIGSPTEPGIWRIRLENTGREAAPAAIAVWTNAK